MSILAKIVDTKRQEIIEDKKQMSEQTLSAQLDTQTRHFEQALRTHRPAIIAEVKKASPSKGVLCEDFAPITIAQNYQACGAACISILTDKHYFQGCNQYLVDIRQAVSLPILRKDFIIDEYQIYQARALGADCILLIVAILNDAQLQKFTRLAQELGMAVLVESHTEDELKRAIKLPTALIGINNRDLNSFKTDLNTSLMLKKLVPNDKLIITESGIKSFEDIQLMQECGIHAFLIGEALMKNTHQILKPLT